MRTMMSALLVLLLPWAVAWAQSPVLTPGDNLVVEGIPPIPVELPAEVQRYTESRGAALVDWHPTRREVLISTRFGNAPQIHRVNAPGGARTQLTFFAEPITQAVFEPRDGSYFVFARDTGGNEFSQFYRYDLARGNVERLTDGGRSQNGGWHWNHAKDRIVYTSTRRNGADRDLWVMDPAHPTTDRMLAARSGGGWSVLAWSPDDSQLAVREYLSINHSNLWLIDTSTGDQTPLSPGGEAVAYGSAEFGADGRGLFLTTDKESEFLRLAYLDLETRQLRILTEGIPWDVEEFAISPDGRHILFAVNEAGASKAYQMDTASCEYHPVSNLPAGVLAGIIWHANSRDVGFTVTSARSAADVYSLDIETGEVSRWTASELGGLIAEELVEPELIRWSSFDGLEVSAFYYRPPARFAGPRPVIINIHGGPEGQSRPAFLARNNYFLNELGIALVYPNVRGSSGYGKSFLKLDDVLKREDSVRDIGGLLDWIAEQSELDPERVMVTGGSYGGYMTLAVATHFNDRIRCSLDVVGISHFGTFLKNTESYRRDLRRAEYGDERDPAVADFFERTAPLNNAGRITKPLFVVQGGNDPRVPQSESQQMVARVQQNGGPVWYLTAKDEGHGFRKKNNADFQFYATVMFVRQFLLDTE